MEVQLHLVGFHTKLFGLLLLGISVCHRRHTPHPHSERPGAMKHPEPQCSHGSKDLPNLKSAHQQLGLGAYKTLVKNLLLHPLPWDFVAKNQQHTKSLHSRAGCGLEGGRRMQWGQARRRQPSTTQHLETLGGHQMRRGTKKRGH